MSWLFGDFRPLPGCCKSNCLAACRAWEGENTKQKGQCEKTRRKKQISDFLKLTEEIMKIASFWQMPMTQSNSSHAPRKLWRHPFTCSHRYTDTRAFANVHFGRPFPLNSPFACGREAETLRRKFPLQDLHISVDRA